MVEVCPICNRDIPEIDQSYKRKQCKQCSKEKRAKYERDYQRNMRKIHEKPCKLCGKITFNNKFCTNQCSRTWYKIDRAEKLIDSYAQKIKQQELKIAGLKNEHLD